MNYTVTRQSFIIHPVTYSMLHYCNFVLYIVLQINNKKHPKEKANKTKLEKQIWLMIKPIYFMCSIKNIEQNPFKTYKDLKQNYPNMF